MKVRIPSLVYYLFSIVIQLGFINFFYGVISFVPELLYLPVNKFFWAKVILVICENVMGFIFIYVNRRRYYEVDNKKLDKFGIFTYIYFVMFNLLSFGYNAVYLIWGAIDTENKALYIRSWSINLLVIIFLNSVAIISKVIFITYYMHAMNLYVLQRRKRKKKE